MSWCSRSTRQSSGRCDGWPVKHIVQRVALTLIATAAAWLAQSQGAWLANQLGLYEFQMVMRLGLVFLALWMVERVGRHLDV